MRAVSRSGPPCLSPHSGPSHTATAFTLTSTAHQCDEGKPTCKRCEKSRRECGGYRPEFEIVHRDQTNSTLRRLRKTADLQHQPSASSSPFIFIQEDPQPWRRKESSSSPSPEAALTVPLAHRVSCYFASNFILLPLGSAPHGFMEYLVPLLEAEPPNSALRYAFNACAFALLGNRARADRVNLAQLSLKEHTLALAHTHRALGQPAIASNDSTLAAVLMLCLYEVSRAHLRCRQSNHLALTHTLFLCRALPPSRRAGCWHGARISMAPSTSSRHAVATRCAGPGWGAFYSPQ